MKTSYNECIINQGTYSWVKRLAVGKTDFYVLKTFLPTATPIVQIIVISDTKAKVYYPHGTANHR